MQDIEKAIGLNARRYAMTPSAARRRVGSCSGRGTIDPGLQPFPLSYRFAEAAGFSDLSPNLEIRAGLRVHRSVPRSRLGQRRRAGRDRLSPRATAWSGCDGRGQEKAAAISVESYRHHHRVRPPRHRRRDQIQIDTRRPRRLRGGHAARLHHPATCGTGAQRCAVRYEPVRRPNFPCGRALAIPTACIHALRCPPNEFFKECRHGHLSLRDPRRLPERGAQARRLVQDPRRSNQGVQRGGTAHRRRDDPRREGFRHRRDDARAHRVSRAR